MTDSLYTCPKCNDVLERRTISDVEVDKCPSCDGVWLDAGELVKLKLSPDKMGIEALDRRDGARKAPPSAGHLRLGCPACDAKMTPLPLQPKVILDHCRQCGGLWLDHKELEPAMNAIGGGGGVSANVVNALIGITKN